MQGLSYLHELWDKLPKIPCKSQKMLDLGYISQGRPFPDGFYFTFVSGYSLGRNHMPQLRNLPLEQLTFGEFEFQPSLFQLLEHGIQPLKMAGWIFWKKWQYHLNRWCTSWDLNPSNESPSTDERSQGHWLIQGHSITFVETQWSYGEHGQWLAFLIHLDLPVARLRVDQGEPLQSLQAIKGLINVGQQIGILYGPVVQLPEVNAKPQATIFLSDQDYHTSTWTVWLPDGTNIQHLLEMGLHVIIHMWGYMSVMLLERHQICPLDPVFDQGCLAQVQVTASK